MAGRASAPRTTVAGERIQFNIYHRNHNYIGHALIEARHIARSRPTRARCAAGRRAGAEGRGGEGREGEWSGVPSPAAAAEPNATPPLCAAAARAPRSVPDRRARREHAASRVRGVALGRAATGAEYRCAASCFTTPGAGRSGSGSGRASVSVAWRGCRGCRGE